jgi:hypothetical protein
MPEPTREETLKLLQEIQSQRKELGAIGKSAGRLPDIDLKLAEQIDALREIGARIDALRAGGELSALLPNARGQEVRELHEVLAELGLGVAVFELKEALYGSSTEESVRIIQRKLGLPVSGIVDARTRELLFRSRPGAAGQSRVEGRLYFADGRPAARVPLQLHSREFGGKTALLARGESDELGRYTLPYDPAKVSNIEVHTVDGAGRTVRLSRTKSRPASQEVLNLVTRRDLVASPAEFRQLADAVVGEIGGLEQLARAVESSERGDLGLLSRATGWDARLLALAAKAQRLAAATRLPAEVLYAALRAGLPADADQLARISSSTLEAGLRKARDAQVIALSDPELAASVEGFRRYTTAYRRERTVAGTLAGFDRLLETSALTPGRRSKFADVFFAHQGTPAELWRKAADEGFTPNEIAALQLQGKLAFLTRNNAELTRRVGAEIGAPDSLRLLPRNGYHKPQTWERALRAIAPDDAALEQAIPPAYVGETLRERLEAYTTDLARRVRLSYPTQVVAQRIRDEELPLARPAVAFRRRVADFLDAAADLGFELGRTPFAGFVARADAQALLAGDAAEAGELREAVATVQRQYQMSPSDESMRVIAELGFTAADDIANMPYEAFMSRYDIRFPSRDEARLVYGKAQQISSVTYNFFTIAKQLESVPPVYALSAPPAEREAVREGLLRHFPTMESLFGSLDYCECEHCRSVLSPAAYLVDLLQFLDLDPVAWTSFDDAWARTHNGRRYSDDYEKPYDALIARRPDIPHIALTCENTTTSMPYIDIVNEILEYHIAFDGLDAAAAHDTDRSSTAQLLAEPRYLIPDAYERLNAARYPLELPFDLPTEVARSFLAHMDVTLWGLLDALRPIDELFRPAAAPFAEYYRSQVFAEQLGLSGAGWALLAEADLATWHTLYGFDAEDAAFAQLKSARTLARRLGISYHEIVDSVSTAFVNPRLDTLVLLSKLGIDVTEVFRFKAAAGYPPFSDEEADEFDSRLIEISDQYAIDSEARLNELWGNGAFNGILVLRDPDTGCNFDLTRLLFAEHRQADADGVDVYAANRDAYALAFLKLNLFTRLRRVLGWSIDELDRALTAVLPANVPLDGANIAAALRSALVYLAHYKTLEGKLKLGPMARMKLATFWSNIPTRGREPLYAKLFLEPGLLKNDPVFDNALGDYLEDGVTLVADHLVSVQAALGMNADDVARVLRAAALDPAAALLTLPNVSLLYRHALLARALKLSIADLVDLKALAGLDPFRRLAVDALDAADNDFPLTHTLRFVDIAAQLKTAGFSVPDVRYLVRHDFDPTGPYRRDAAALVGLARALATDLRQVDVDYAVPADPLAVSDDVLRARLTEALQPDAVERLLGLVMDTHGFEAVRPVLPGDALDPADYAEEPDLTVTYDAVRHEQHLASKGALTDARKEFLQAKYADAEFGALLDDLQAQAIAFVTEQFMSAVPPLGNFLTAGDYDRLFATPADLHAAAPAAVQAAQQLRRSTLVRAFWPAVRERVQRGRIKTRLLAAIGVEPTLVQALLEEPGLVHAPGAVGTALINAFRDLADIGATRRTFNTPDATGAPSGAATVATVDGARRPAATGSITFRGVLEVVQTGPYRFFGRLERQDARAEMRFEHLTEPVFSGQAAADGDEVSGVIELQAGVPYSFAITATNLAGGDFQASVQGDRMPRASLEQLSLIPADALDRFERAYVRLSKIASTAQRLGLGVRELRHARTRAAEFDGLDFNLLPTAADDVAADVPLVFRQFMRLVGLAAVKRDMGIATPDALADILEGSQRRFAAGGDAAAARSEVFDGLCTSLAVLTRREASAVAAVAGHLGYQPTSALAAGVLTVTAAAFAQEQTLARLWAALQMLQRLGVPLAALTGVATVIDSTAPHDDRLVAARDLQNALKALYDQEAWLRVAPSVVDKLRQRQRDALVAHILHTHPEGFTDANQLFEYFLIDPGMEPVVRTSRIRLALSSVQLFIQRCFLNLEPRVNAAALNARHWQWMKRYRIWEVNRKIFLYPENWLEPEFRDDRTHLFQELEGALLQDDVTNDLAEDAFFQYLRRLEELARLEIVSIYAEENPLDPAANALHVLGRTFAEPHQYFYRRLVHEMWTPWEPVGAGIDGNHVVLAMWRDRLHVFWMTFLEEVEPAAAPPAPPSESGLATLTMSGVRSAVPRPVTKTVKVSLRWSDHANGEWSPPSSTSFSRQFQATTSVTVDVNNEFIHITKETENGEDGPLTVHLSGDLDIAFRLVSRLAPPERATATDNSRPPYQLDSADAATHFTATGTFAASYADRIAEAADGTVTVRTATPAILQNVPQFSLVASSAPNIHPNPDIGALVAPVFYQDSRYTFLVEPTVTETTIEEWNEYVITEPVVIPDDVFVPEIPIERQFPFPIPPWPPEEYPPMIDPIAEIPLSVNPALGDWVTRPGTLVEFDGGLVGRSGIVPGLDDLAGGGGGPIVALTRPGEVVARNARAAGVDVVGSGRALVAGAQGVRAGAVLASDFGQGTSSLNGAGFGAAGGGF